MVREQDSRKSTVWLVKVVTPVAYLVEFTVEFMVVSP